MHWEHSFQVFTRTQGRRSGIVCTKSCTDDPKCVEIPNANSGYDDKRREALQKKKQLGKLYLMSFRLVTGLKQDVYNNLLVIAGLLKKDARSGDYRVVISEWKKFFTEFNIDAEFDGVVILKNIFGNSKCYHMRLGPKRSGYNQKVSMQIKSGKHEPPRTPAVTIERRNLRRVLNYDMSDGIVQDDDTNDDVDALLTHQHRMGKNCSANRIQKDQG